MFEVFNMLLTILVVKMARTEDRGRSGSSGVGERRRSRSRERGGGGGKRESRWGQGPPKEDRVERKQPGPAKPPPRVSY